MSADDQRNHDDALLAAAFARQRQADAAQAPAVEPMFAQAMRPRPRLPSRSLKSALAAAALLVVTLGWLALQQPAHTSADTDLAAVHAWCDQLRDGFARTHEGPTSIWVWSQPSDGWSLAGRMAASPNDDR